jgi:DNA-binding NtrC family response regulator
MSNFVTLLVEDDSLQRELMANELAGEGFEVVECTTAEAAEAIIASTGADLIALITDQNLAGEMTGTELAAYASERHPHLSIVVMSGSIIAWLPKDTVFLQKPFLPCKLLDAIRPN